MSSNKKTNFPVPVDLGPLVLSNLPTKEAVVAGLLLKRGFWNDALKGLSKLEFFFDRTQSRVSFENFVNKVLEERKKGGSTLASFSLTILEGEEDLDPNLVKSWINYAIGKGVESMEIRIYGGDSFDPRVLQQESLVDLKLAGNISIDGPEIGLPLLKKLCLEDVQIEDEVFEKLVSGCPKLEELLMVDMKFEEACVVKSKSLKLLKITRDDNKEEDEPEDQVNPESVSFDTPNLVYLEYRDYVAKEYPTVNCGSLIQAKIDIRTKDGEDGEEGEEEIVGDADAFVVGIRGVEKLQLTENAIEVLELNCGPIPAFMNLTQLQIQSFETMGWGSVPKLLRNCPKLEELIFQGLLHMVGDACGDVCLCDRSETPSSETPSCLVTSTVKVLKIYERGDVMTNTEKFSRQIRHFLVTMPNLRELMMYGETPDGVSALREIADQFRGLEGKASPNVWIRVLSA